MVQNSFDYQRFYYLILSIFTISISDINSKTSTHWFLNEVKEQIIPGFRCNNEHNENYQHSERTQSSESCTNCCNKHSKNSNNDMFQMDLDNFEMKIMRILSDNPRIYYENGTWELKYPSEESEIENNDELSNLDILLIWDQNSNSSTEVTSFEHLSDSIEIIKPNSYKITAYPSSVNISPQSNEKSESSNAAVRNDQMLSDIGKTHNLLTCYPYVNQTKYDHLNGIYYRDTYKFHPEPEVAMIFSKKSNRHFNVKINLENVEAQLTEAKAKRPNSPNVYNNIGNLLRVHGQSREAVECFRCALRLSPHHPDALLNLARVLYNQNYLEDAIYLTRHSLETQPRNRNPWLQHFTLGEILRSIGRKQEAKNHFMHVLELNPGFRPAKDYLQELGSKTNSITTIYSVCITIFLLSLVFYALFLNVEFNDSENENQKTHRHFNRGMAMKTLRTLNSKPRSKRNT